MLLHVIECVFLSSPSLSLSVCLLLTKPLFIRDVRSRYTYMYVGEIRSRLDVRANCNRNRVTISAIVNIRIRNAICHQFMAPGSSSQRHSGWRKEKKNRIIIIADKQVILRVWGRLSLCAVWRVWFSSDRFVARLKLIYRPFKDERVRLSCVFVVVVFQTSLPVCSCASINHYGLI